MLFIFDDFIHVVDTIAWLCPGRANDFSVSYVMREGLLYQVMIKLDGEGFTAIGTMNRDSGMNEEQLSVIGAGEKVVVRDLNTMVRFRNGEENHEKFGDWEPVLKRRGFEDIVRLFLRQAKGGTPDFSDMESALQSHQLCEEIVNYIEKNETGAVK